MYPANGLSAGHLSSGDCQNTENKPDTGHMTYHNELPARNMLLKNLLFVKQNSHMAKTPERFGVLLLIVICIKGDNALKTIKN